MRLSLVLSIFGMLAVVLSTRFDIIGTIECQAAPPWCYTIKIIDATYNVKATSLSACELANNNKKFHFKLNLDWGGVFDRDFELQLLIQHDCGIEIDDEMQTMRLSFGQLYSKRGQNQPQHKYHRNFDSERLELNSDSFKKLRYRCIASNPTSGHSSKLFIFISSQHMMIIF
ncbi:hypothetical protein B9Z55_025155 [Caenorhabditis nigoni]|uniref:ZP domain-containing protein n=1 Tax=Caenorhabditis nigoni TaxID=1611254 RepID=A0A2G5SXX0_9PELO|nr:hypothetical protein B9Z55_025155 [Caenorhabditis nigoni]